MTRDSQTMTQPPAAEPLHRSRAAERMRLYRQRRRHGLRCVTVQLRVMEIDGLISKSLLKQEARNDPDAITDALHAFLERALDGQA